VVGDDYARVHIVDPAVADVGAVDSPFIDISDVFYVQPGVPVPLVLFVVPQSDVHVTMGLVPQKKVGMLREWTSAALAKLSPASRYGPVLRDPKATRLPVPADVRGTWAWNRRADATTWVADEVVPATQDAVLPLDPALVSEGWLSVTLIPDTQYSNTAQRIEVTHIRSRRYKSGKQLLGIGGTNKDGSHFLIPVQDAARLQETGRFVFFVQDAGHGPTDTKVVTRKGTKYLWTTHDRRQPNNLLSLPEAPADW
jgi:hypothetical protein